MTGEMWRNSDLHSDWQISNKGRVRSRTSYKARIPRFDPSVGFWVIYSGTHKRSFSLRDLYRDAWGDPPKGWEPDVGQVSKSNRVPVRCVENGVTYESLSVAAEELNISRSWIGRASSGKYPSACGYHFERNPE